ncbi:MAG TPA: DUF370 domain-containing protein [Spirochaetota bacterium]|nr:DUF370 domain-containing protein [Spirochaetota bacterium]HOL57598.1 DUF370 domain-containing protein [Spirochaetota bacterium]HPP05095.1 DUF370 domain-containing protein [Spirochaetota bacterium]
MIDIGYKNFVNEKKIRKIMKFEKSKTKWIRKEAIAGNVLIDCTQGRKTNSLIIMKSGHVILSSLKQFSLKKRLKAIKSKDNKNTTKEMLLNALSKLKEGKK